MHLSTRREDNGILIKVTDDGVGFQPMSYNKEESVGLKNVQYRLEKMVNGSLDIESHPGEGTTVTIKIPILKEEHENEDHIRR